MHVKERRAFVLAALLLLTCIAVTACARPDPILILISLDGFRWDYLDLVETPNLNRLASGGVRAEGLIPVYPSKTFPSHYSMVTGLHPGHHGIISNNMYDSEMDSEFHLYDREAVGDGRWWGGEPIWVTAERAGIALRLPLLAGVGGGDRRFPTHPLGALRRQQALRDQD